MKCSYFIFTLCRGQLESVRSLYTNYATKRKKLHRGSFEARLRTAALDHNLNVNTAIAKTKTGQEPFKHQYSKVQENMWWQPGGSRKTEPSGRTLCLAGCEGPRLDPSVLHLDSTKQRLGTHPGQHKGVEKPQKAQSVARTLSCFTLPLPHGAPWKDSNQSFHSWLFSDEFFFLICMMWQNKTVVPLIQTSIKSHTVQSLGKAVLMEASTQAG